MPRQQSGVPTGWEIESESHPAQNNIPEGWEVESTSETPVKQETMGPPLPEDYDRVLEEINADMQQSLDAQKGQPQKKGWGEYLWEAPEPLRRFARSVGDYLGGPLTKEDVSSMSTMSRTGYPTTLKQGESSALAQFAAGAVGGVGKIGTPEEVTGLAGFASPANVGLMALGGAEGVALRQAVGAARAGQTARAASALRTARRLAVPRQLAGVNTAYGGLQKVANADLPWYERIRGIPEMAMGAVMVPSHAIPVARRMDEAKQAGQRRTPPAEPPPTTPAEPPYDPLGGQPIRPTGGLRQIARESIDPTADLGTPFQTAPEQDIFGRSTATQTGPITFDIDLRSSEQPPEMRELDPRITSLPPQTGGPPVPEPPSGIVGPPPTVAQPTEGTLEAEDKLAAMRKANVTRARPPREMTEEAEEAFLAEGEPPVIQRRPTSITVKKDIPATVNKLMEQGYDLTGHTEEGYPIMAPLKIAQAPIVQQRPIEPELLPAEQSQALTPELVQDEPINFDVVGTDISGAVSPEDLARIPGPTSKRKLGIQAPEEDVDTFEGQVLGRGPDEVDLTIPPKGKTGITPEPPDIIDYAKEDYTPEEWDDRKKKIAYDWAKARERARDLQIETKGMRHLYQLHDAIRRVDPEWEPPYEPIAGMDKPEMQREKYEPQIGRSGVFGTQNFETMLRESTDQELEKYIHQLTDNLRSLTEEAENLPFTVNRHAAGQAKRRVIFAQKKLQKMEDELNRRQSEKLPFDEPEMMAEKSLSRFKIKDALTTKGMDDPISVALSEAKHLGLNIDDYDRLDELQWAITRRTFQELQRTGKNPLTDPNYNPEGAPEYEHRAVPPPIDEPQMMRTKKEDEFEKSLTNRIKAEGTMSFEDKWKEAIEVAEDLGVDWRKYDDIDKLREAIVAADEKQFVRKEGLPYKSDKYMMNQMLGDRGDEPWIPRKNDPPEIIAMRQELKKLNDKQNALIDAEDPSMILDTSESVLSPEESERYNQLAKEIGEYDDMGNKPQMMRTPEGKLTIGQNVQRSAREVASGYKAELPGIMVREGMQNGLDALKAMIAAMKARGINYIPQLTIKIDTNTNSITISDNGKGMTLKEIETVYTDLFESGKTGQAEASGGKGIGKATYMLSGQTFHAETVAIDIDGKKYRHTIDIDPDTVFTEGITEKREVVPNTTPTGTTFTTILGEGQDINDARHFLTTITDYSRDLPGKLNITHIYANNKDVKWKTAADDTQIGEADLPNAKVVLSYPKGTERKEQARYLSLRILNNGMYQYSEDFYASEETAGLPRDIIVDIRPKVEEGTTAYPFPTQRESLKAGILEKIQKLVQDKLVSPVVGGRKAKLQELYDNMHPVRISGGSGRETVIYDAGKRLTPAESQMFKNSPVIKGLISAYDEALKGILDSVGNQKWIDKLERVGLVFFEEPTSRLHGIHIPNPLTPRDKSAILINPFSREDTDPADVAFFQMETLLHETAHIGDEAPALVHFDPNELNDPRIGKYLQSYIKHVASSTGYDIGHGVSFIKRLGQIYGKFGPTKFFEAYGKILQAISDDTGGFNSEYQELLSIYKESRGRAATQEDYLSSTGIKHAAPRGSEGSNVGGTTGLGGGTTTGRVPPHLKRVIPKKNTEEYRRLMVEQGFRTTGESTKEGLPIWTKDEPPSKDIEHYINEVWNYPRGMLSVDLPVLTSAAFRQGAGVILLKPEAWAKGFVNAARAYGSKYAFETVMAKLSQNKYFREREDAEGNRLPSIAREAGLRMGDLSSIGKREENIKSTWTEKLPGIFGKHVRGSNRAYQAFANTVRSVSFSIIADQMKDDSLSMLGRILPGKDVATDKEFAKKLADMINVLSGQSKVRIETPRVTVRGKEYGLPPWVTDASAATKYLVNVFYSPQLQASRLAMLNPATYINTDPKLRGPYIRGTIGAMAVWWTIVGLAKLAYDETEVSLDPNSADFGKIRIGDTRFDPGAGMQKYLVYFSRVRPQWLTVPFPVPLPTGDYWEDPGGGQTTSSTTERSRRFGTGYPPEGRQEQTIDAIENNLHPSARYLWDLWGAQQNRPFRLLDRSLQLAMPIWSADVAEALTTDPGLIPALLFASSLGVGTSTYTRGEPEPVITPHIPDFMGGTLDEWDISIGSVD